MSDKPLIQIIGGGLTGMTTALAIRDLAAKRDLPQPRIQILEATPRAGGKIQTSQFEGYTCEWGVNGFLNKEPKTLELCQRLGIAEQLQPATGAFKKRYIYTRGKLRSVQMHPLKFLFSGLLPLGALLRLIREPWIKARPTGGSDESVADFARRRIGPVAYQVLVDSMQTGIYAGDPEQMSVASAFPRVVEVERQYGSLIRGMAKLAKERKAQGEPLPGAGPAGHLTSFKGGMQVLIDALTSALGDQVCLSRTVQAISAQESALSLTIQGQEELTPADAVVLACPAHAAASITRALDPELSAILAEIPYPPLAVVCLGYPRAAVAHPMDGFGYLVPRTAQLRILGTLWTSTIFPNNTPEGDVFLRVMIGGARDPEAIELSDDSLLEFVQRELTQVQGVTGAPTFKRVFRHLQAIPQYVIGHGDRLDRIEGRLKRLPGLYITGNAYRGIGVNDCAKNAWPMAEQVLADLANQ